MKHGNARRTGRTTEYRAWKAMMERCYRVNNPKYPRYGGRGIIVCERWRRSVVEWFLIAMLGARMVVLGPLSEEGCQMYKRTIFQGQGTCIEGRIINARLPA